MVKYKFPKAVNSMTIHHLYGINKRSGCKTVDDYVRTNDFCLAADLLAQEFSPSDIEKAVNSGVIEFAHWPEKTPSTEMFWSKDSKSVRKLDDLAKEAIKFCYGETENDPIGGNFATVGAEMGNQQMALAGLIYARVTKKVREISELDQGQGPLYVKKGSFSDKIFQELIPEKNNN